MLEWLAIIALAAVLLRLRARVDSLEAHEAGLRSTIAELRGRLLAFNAISSRDRRYGSHHSSKL